MRQAAWSADMASGLPAMDQLHQELFSGVDALSNVPDSDFHRCYDHFVSDTERKFATEERWMEEIDYPGVASHREQHARVLGALHNVHAYVMDGDIALGREMVERLLPQWLALHISTMDVALAAALQFEGRQPTPAENADTYCRV